MGYQVALSPSAHRDLRDIVRYISLDSPDRAIAFGQFLVSNTKRLDSVVTRLTGLVKKECHASISGKASPQAS